MKHMMAALFTLAPEQFEEYNVKSMRYFVFLDRYDLLPIISGLTEDADEMVVIKAGPPFTGRPSSFSGRLFEWKDIYIDEVVKLDIKPSDRVIIATSSLHKFGTLLNYLSTPILSPPVLALTERPNNQLAEKIPNLSVIDMGALARKYLAVEWKWIEIRQKVRRLRKALSGAGKVLILTQNDPDPDAISCGMALQVILGRDDNTAPICTFGQVTRKENQAMIRLLRTNVRTITPDDLGEFDKIAMVDVQPPYFREVTFKKVDAVIDHHPYASDYEAVYKDVNISYGATSTICHEYLTAIREDISTRLATALLYGIISDTMSLARDTSSRDFDAFTALWPRGNTQMLATMSRPRLDPQELSYFVQAINNRKVEGDFVFIWLGNIDREDIIPRLADFSLQIGESVWSAVGGAYEGNIIISIRNAGSRSDAGEVASMLFSKYGSAGGHQSMAKAVVGLDGFKNAFSLKSMKQVGERLFKMFTEALAEEL